MWSLRRVGQEMELEADEGYRAGMGGGDPVDGEFVKRRG